MAYWPYTPRTMLGFSGLNWNELTTRARIAYRDGYYREAEELHEMALAVSRKGGRPDGLWAAETLSYLGVIADQCGEYRRAEERLQGALFLFERCSHSRYRGPHLAQTLCDLGLVYTNLGAYGRAEALLNRALLHLGGLADANGWHVETIHNLAHVRRVQGRLDEAESLYTRMRELILKEYGPDHRGMGAYHLGMCYLYAAREQYRDAACAAMKALCVHRNTMRPGHPRMAAPYAAWAYINMEQGRYSAAEPLLRRALRIRESSLGADSPTLLSPLKSLATVLRKRGCDGEAEALETRLTHIEELNADK
jgi:tetratricopeptide (TPR) repeat protein